MSSLKDGIKKFRSDTAIILNISPDHMDRYDYNFENYVQSKFKITKNQNLNDFLIYNSDDQHVNLIESNAKLPISLINELNEGGYLKKRINN